MGLFRPARTVTGPTGDQWEIYVSKTALPDWKMGDGGDYQSTGFAEADAVGVVGAAVSAVWSILVVPLFRFVALLPIAFIRGRRSQAVRIEAVNNFPEREVLLWTTTDGFRDAVVDEIARGLAAGKVVQPAAAVFSGRELG